jgi:methylated-DNA-[protein]-cysteine S-methyltransferase
MAPHEYALFQTVLGRCGIAWGERGVALFQLPEARDDFTRRRILYRLPEAREASAPAEIVRAMQAVLALLGGERRDLREIELDMQGVPEFHRKVYVAARQILPGSTLTYGEIARRIGVPGSARAVGQALGRNPFAIIVPCHRVVAAGGKLGGFSANGGRRVTAWLQRVESWAVSRQTAGFLRSFAYWRSRAPWLSVNSQRFGSGR